MKKAGDPGNFSAVVRAAPSTVGPMIIVCSLPGLSVGKLFLAGAVRGQLTGFAVMFTTYFIARKKNLP